MKIFLSIGLLLSCLVILFAARGDLWLDEIWSIFIAEAAKTPWEIISVYKHDNNHILNTLFLFFLGKQQNLLYYRLFAVISGIASLVLIIKITLRWGRLESIFALLLTGISYPLILYFSEARGYAQAIYFALLSFFIIQENRIEYRPVKLFLFWVTAILGTLAHLTYIIVFLSLIPYLIYCELNADKTLIGKLKQILKYLAVPMIFILLFYFFYVRSMSIGGGPPIDMQHELTKGIACLLGLPGTAWYATIPILAFLVSAVAYLQYADKNPLWVFSLSVMIIVPASLIIITKPTYFHFRYVVVCFPFYYLMMSYLLAKAFRVYNKALRFLLVLAMSLYCVGQCSRLVPFFQYGRGSYQAIVTEMANSSSLNEITVGSDNDFRNKMVLSFYARFLPNQKKIRYIDQQFWNGHPPAWLIVHDLDESAVPEPWIQASSDQMYRLIKAEKFSGNSGFSWFLYRNSSK